MVIIQERYKDFNSLPSVKDSISRMLAGIPPDRISGLHSIILTNTQALSRESRRRKTRSSGWYWRKTRTDAAYIEIVVDNILQSWPSWFLKSNFLTDLAFSNTIFHEIGHHIHTTQAPEFKEKEQLADKWQKKLSKHYFWKRYWCVMILHYPFKGIINWLRKRIN